MDQQSSCVLGVLGLLRLLLPQLIRGYSADYQDDSDSVTDAGQQQLQQLKQKGQQHHQQAASAATTECRQIIEIYDYCLHLLSTQHTTNHAIINAALEVINGILQALHGSNGMPAAAPAAAAGESLGQSLRQLLCNQQLEHNEYLRRRKSLKNQIFQLKNYQLGASQQQQAAPATPDAATAAVSGVASRQMQMQKNSNAKVQQQQECQQQQQRRQQSGSNLLQVVGINAVADDADTEKDAAASSVPDEGKVNNALQVELALCLCLCVVVFVCAVM